MRQPSLFIAWSLSLTLSCSGKPPPDNPFITTDQAAIGFNQIFGEGTYIGQSPNQALAITNNGLGDLHIKSITFSGDNVFTMTTVAPPPITLKGDQQTFVNVVFAPTESKMYTGKITINSDAENTMSSNGDLVIAVSGLGLGARIVTDKMAVDFTTPAVALNTTSSATLQLQNPTPVDLHVSALTLTGDSAFTVGFPLPDAGTEPVHAVTINGNASQTVVVSFKPTAAQTYMGTFNVASDADNSKSLDVPLTGKGM
jgi:hypothetical protein